jgi:hypothetical protein
MITPLLTSSFTTLLPSYVSSSSIIVDRNIVVDVSEIIIQWINDEFIVNIYYANLDFSIAAILSTLVIKITRYYALNIYELVNL